MPDVFISFKNPGAGEQETESMRLAERLYRSLCIENYDVFYSPVSLNNRHSEDWQLIIDENLDSSQLMLLVFTKAEELFSLLTIKNGIMLRYLASMKLKNTSKTIGTEVQSRQNTQGI